MEYALNSLNTVSQMTVPVARELPGALSRALSGVTGPLQRFVPNTWPITGTAVDAPTTFVLVGVLVFVVGYLTLRRA